MDVPFDKYQNVDEIIPSRNIDPGFGRYYCQSSISGAQYYPKRNWHVKCVSIRHCFTEYVLCGKIKVNTHVHVT